MNGLRGWLKWIEPTSVQLLDCTVQDSYVSYHGLSYHTF